MKEARKLPYDWRPYDKKYNSYPICRECVSLDVVECQLVDDFRIDCSTSVTGCQKATLPRPNALHVNCH
jgi:hypothetical protein